MTNQDLQSIRDGKYDDSLLKGIIHESARFVISTGRSDSSKDVMFVLYACGQEDVYLGNLSNDFNKAMVSAREKCGKFQIDVDVDIDLNKRRGSNTFPFGKYVGKSVEDVFDIDPKYIYWAACNMPLHRFSSKMIDVMMQYSRLAKDIVIEENANNSNPPIEIEKTKKERVLTVTSLWRTNYETIGHRLVDGEGNLFQYTGKFIAAKGETVTIPCKVTKTIYSMGKVINKINLR